MSEAKAVICDQCRKTEAVPKGESVNPPTWWYISGPRGEVGRLDFCSRACLSLYFHPTAGQPSVVVVGGGGGGAGGLTWNPSAAGQGGGGST